MRKRGKYGLTNTIYTSKIGGFLPNIILGSEALLLRCQSARAFQELHPQLHGPGKLPNSPSFDDAGRWTLGSGYTGRAGSLLTEFIPCWVIHKKCEREVAMNPMR